MTKREKTGAWAMGTAFACWVAAFLYFTISTELTWRRVDKMNAAMVTNCRAVGGRPMMNVFRVVECIR